MPPSHRSPPHIQPPPPTHSSHYPPNQPLQLTLPPPASHDTCYLPNSTQLELPSCPSPAACTTHPPTSPCSSCYPLTSSPATCTHLPAPSKMSYPHAQPPMTHPHLPALHNMHLDKYVQEIWRWDFCVCITCLFNSTQRTWGLDVCGQLM